VMLGLLPALLATVTGSTAGVAGGSTHVPPPVSLHYELDAEELHLTINVQEPVYETWFPTVASRIPELDGDGYEAELAQARELVLEKAPVQVDGVAVLPRVVMVEYLEQLVENDYLNYVVIEVVYGMKSVPKAIELQWSEFRGEDPNWPLMQVDATFEYEVDLQLLVFTPEGSVVTWLQPELPPIPEPADLAVGVVPPLAVPWASLTALVVGLAALVAGLRGAFPLRRGWPAVAATFAAAVPLSLLPPAEWRAPWQPAFVMPDEDHARYLFESLHLNVYRAFDYDTESDIYDALAQSVEAGLLDQVYDEVYRGLIMAEEGGLLSRVRGVEMLESEVTLPEPADEPRFEVACRWRVKGSVEHWGHRHLRTNEYRARYTVRGEGERWRLASVEVTDLGRIDDLDELGGPQ
jgi:hypothetical protein